MGNDRAYDVVSSSVIDITSADLVIGGWACKSVSGLNGRSKDQTISASCCVVFASWQCASCGVPITWFRTFGAAASMGLAVLGKHFKESGPTWPGTGLA